MKKISTLLLVNLLIVSSCFTVFADSNRQQGFVEEEIIEEEITYEEYIESLAKSLNMSIEEARAIDKKESEEFEAQLKKEIPELFKVNEQLFISSLFQKSSANTGTYTYRRVS